MRNALIDELRHVIWAIALIIAVGVWAIVRLREPSREVVATATPVPETRIDRLEREVQAVVDADRVLAASRGGVPVLAQPAVSVIRDLAPGLSGAQVAQILAGLKAPTREVIAATSRLVGPKPTASPTAPPGWTEDQVRAVYEAARKADQDVLADPATHIATTLEVKRQEVQATRIGSTFTPSGAGLGYAFVRRGHFEIVAGAVVRGAHLSPVVSPEWLIPHTSIACGPSMVYDRRAIVGAACTAHF